MGGPPGWHRKRLEGARRRVQEADQLSASGLALAPADSNDMSNQPESEVPDELLPPGTLVGDRYEIGEVLAWGGMGIVYRALHLELDSEVAVKMMRRELVDDDSAYE